MSDHPKRKRDEETEDVRSRNKRMRLLKENDELLHLAIQHVNNVLQLSNETSASANQSIVWLERNYLLLCNTFRDDLEGTHSLLRLLAGSLANWTQKVPFAPKKKGEEVDDDLSDDTKEMLEQEEGLLIVIKLLGELPQKSEEDATRILVALLNKIYGDKKVAVRGTKRLGRQILRSLLQIVGTDNLQNEERMISKILKQSPIWQKLLSDWDPNIRAMSLLLIVRTSNANHAVCKLCCSHMHDRDARVRAQAVKCLQEWLKVRPTSFADDIHEAEREATTVAGTLYPEVVTALRDDYADVKSGAMTLLCELANRHPKYRQSGLSIVEDAFMRLCAMVRDTTVSVRSMACGLLGKLERSDLIAGNVLLETFNKMSLNYHNNKHPHQQQHQPVTQVGQGTESGTQPDIHGEITEDEEDSRLYADAIGTFVLGLEDEFRQVRLACLESIGLLSTRNTEFANRSIRFLLETFNDEIDEVRIAAIRCLTSIARHGGEGSVRLDHEQLLIVLILLEDRNRNIRFAVHDLLSDVYLSGGHASLAATVKALVVNELRKYGDGILSSARQERESVYRCLARMGYNHPELSEFLVEELLQIRPHLMSAEQPLDDDNDPYIGALILLFNASIRNETIVLLMPDHIRRKHLDQIRTRWPQFFPDSIRVLSVGRHHAITISNEEKQYNHNVNRRHEEHELRNRLVNGFEQAKRLARCGELRSAHVTLRALHADLSRPSSQSPLCAFASIYLKMCNLYLGMLMSSSKGITNGGRHQTIHRDLMRVVRKIRAIYVTEENDTLSRQLDLVRCMVLVHRSKMNSHEFLKDIITERIIELSDFIQGIPDPRALFPSLVLPSEMFLSYVPSYVILSPQSNGPDKCISFPSYVPLSLHVECKIEHPNVKKGKYDNRVHLLVQFPDGSHSLFPLMQSSSISDETIVQSDVRIDMESWTEPAPLTLSIVLLCQNDDPIVNTSIGDDALESRFVVVSDRDVKVYVNPHQ